LIQGWTNDPRRYRSGWCIAAVEGGVTALPPLLEANRIPVIVALSRGRGDRQDRRDHQDYPKKHAHRNLVQTSTIERRRLRRGSRPTASHLIPLKSRGRQPAGIHSFRQRSFQNIHDLLTGAQWDTVLRACRNEVDTPLQKVRWFEGALFDYCSVGVDEYSERTFSCPRNDARSRID
jgi:hypothetical protein